MASEIRVNQIQSRTGVSTISFTETGPIFAGVSTVQGLFTVDEDLNVGGNLNVSGVLTYDDVTNIDSVGVVTARSGVHFGTAASGTLVVGDSDGIGIGTDNPLRKLDILGTGRPVEIGSTNATNIVKLYNSATGRSTYNGVDIQSNSTAGGIISAYGGYLDLRTSSSNGSDATSRLLITSSGFVGLGTDNPHHELHIQGSGDTRALISSGGTGDAVMMFENASGETWGHGMDLTNNNYVVAYSHLGDPSLTNDGALRITSDAKIGLGLDNPNARFHVHSSSNHVATFEYSATSDCAIQLKNAQGSMYFGLGGGEEFMVGIGTDLNGAGNTKLSVDQNGAVKTPDQPTALVYKTGTTQNFTADGLVTYDATSYNQGGITIGGTRSRMTVPAAGKYMVNACTSGSCTVASAGDGWKIRILKNGSVYNDTYGFPIETTGTSTGQELAYVVSMVVDASASDYFEIEIENIGGAAAQMSYGYFGIYLLG